MSAGLGSARRPQRDVAALAEHSLFKGQLGMAALQVLIQELDFRMQRPHHVDPFLEERVVRGDEGV